MANLKLVNVQFTFDGGKSYDIAAWQGGRLYAFSTGAPAKPYHLYGDHVSVLPLADGGWMLTAIATNDPSGPVQMTVITDKAGKNAAFQYIYSDGSVIQTPGFSALVATVAGIVWTA